MAKNFRVVVTNEADITYFGYPSWRTLANVYRMESGRRFLITHKCRGSFVAFSISKSVKPNEELKVGLIFSQVLSTIDTTLRRLDVYSF